MWQRFTERARRVILLGQEEAGKMNSGHVGTEHLLLGLLREKGGVAAQILEKMGITLDKVRPEVEALVKPEHGIISSEPKLTPKAKRTLELAADEARRMRVNYIGTEHLLLALLREKNGLAATVLRGFGLSLEKTRSQVMAYLGSDESGPPAVEAASAQPNSHHTRAITDFVFAPEVMVLLSQASIEAKKGGDTLLTPEHLLLALVENPDGAIAGLLQSVGLDLEKARAISRKPGEDEPNQAE